MSQHSAPASLLSRVPPVYYLSTLKKDLQKVAEDRPKFYGRKMAILVYWEEDETDAKRDIITMSNVMEDFGITWAAYILKAADPAPGWDLLHRIQQAISECNKIGEPCLFVFHYVGHGVIINGELSFACGRKLLTWSYLKRDLFGNLEVMKDIDVLVILDCCHSASARSQITTPRTCQIIAACGTEETTKDGFENITFTRRLYQAVQSLNGKQGEPVVKGVTTAALYDQIQHFKPLYAPNAVMETLGGTQPIKLLFKNTSPVSPSRIPRPSRPYNDTHVLVKLTLKGSKSEIFDGFTKAIQDLPDNMKVEVKNAFETVQSVFLLLRMTWEAWSLWTMVAHLEYVGTLLDRP